MSLFKKIARAVKKVAPLVIANAPTIIRAVKVAKKARKGRG